MSDAIGLLNSRIDDLQTSVKSAERKIDIFKDKTAEKDLSIIKSLTEIEGALDGFEKFEDAVNKQLTKKGAMAYGGISAGGVVLILEFIIRVLS